ncbi:hypothetical protein KIN20_009410 [Parelaphostrongylus tenuis]|uniref:Uncharacterized protein n=1 Tax=Parelaphostrongylus tenuis TaxID=148309 RepID=A0AAD5MB43_PARTN|nr:hypothetical protein KIN20_009410 [Parelaphostrongylus tenuis]
MEDSRSSVLEEREQDPTATGAEDERSTFAVVWRVEAPLQHVRDFTFIMLDQLDLELDRLYWELERYVMAQRTGRFSWTQHEKRAAQSKCVHIEEKEEVYERLLWTSWELEDEELSSDVDDAYDILEAAVPLHGTKNFVLYVVEQTDQNLDLQYEDLERYVPPIVYSGFSCSQKFPFYDA